MSAFLFLNFLFLLCIGRRRCKFYLFLHFKHLWLFTLFPSSPPPPPPALPPSRPPLLQCIPCGRNPSRYQEAIVSLPSTSLCERASSIQSWSLWSPITTQGPANKSGTTVTPFWSSMMTLQTSPVSSLLYLPHYELLVWEQVSTFPLNLKGIKGNLSKGNVCFDLHKRIISFFTPTLVKETSSNQCYTKCHVDLVTVMWLPCLSWPQQLL